MPNYIFALIIFVIIAVVILHFYLVTDKYLYVKSSDNKSFYVLDLPDADKAAEYLNDINRNIGTLLFSLKKKYGTNHPIVKNIIKRYNPDIITEHKPNFLNSSTAYTSNKGEELFICLRDWKNGGKLLPFNEIMFVSLHELTHISISPWGHPKPFWSAFKWILKESVDVGIYKPVNYYENSFKYCVGLEVRYNPYFDPNMEYPDFNDKKIYK